MLACAALTSGAAALTLDDSDAKAPAVLDGERTIAVYRTDWNVPYVYPLKSPSGANLTRHWPMRDDFEDEERDHPHHRSMWFSHGAVNGHDFWAFHDDGKSRIVQKALATKQLEDGGIEFIATLDWNSPETTLLTETRTITFTKPDENTYVIDHSSELTAVAAEVTLGDTKEGTFALRFDRTLRLKGKTAAAHAFNSNGDTDLDCWGKRAEWVAYSGPDENGEPAVIAIFEHPGNFRHPTWWHARDYGLVAANPFGQHDFETDQPKGAGDFKLANKESLTLRYRVILHRGSQESANIPVLWQKYAIAKAAPPEAR